LGGVLGCFFFWGPLFFFCFESFCALWCLDVFLKLPFREACASPHALHATRASEEAVNCGERREEEEEEEKEKNRLV
jgi:hypothetical protein